MPGELSTASRGFSVMELMIVVTILLLLTAIEIPDLMRAPMAASQAAAVANLQTIEAAEVTYAVTYNHGYSAFEVCYGNHVEDSPAPGCARRFD